MKVKIFQAGAGDSLLLKSSGDPTHRILVDGGFPTAYDTFIAKAIGDMGKAGENIDVVYISHIDRDHIGGILRLLDAKVAWRIYNHLDGTPNAVSEPRVPEPPEIGEIWHNAFFEDFNMNTPDIVTTLSGIGTVALGHAEVTVRRDGERTAFLGQSVGDAIEVSRRISDGQLGIPLNPAAGTGFLILKDGLDIPDVGPFEISILGPTPANLRGLIDTWNKWLEEHQHFLQGVIDDHEVDEDLLASSSHSGPIRIVEAQAENLIASSQRVTPPNVASLTLLVKEGNRRIILSGDADDVDITGGLETQGLMDANGRIHVDVFKVPHHGAANSYSDDLAERVIADNYVFCGNGEHDNPELDVVRGYVDARRRIAAANPGAANLRRRMKLWFNHSHHEALEEEDAREAKGKKRDDDRVEHWEHLEALLDGFESDDARPRVVSRFLKNARSMTFNLKPEAD